MQLWDCCCGIWCGVGVCGRVRGGVNVILTRSPRRLRWSTAATKQLTDAKAAKGIIAAATATAAATTTATTTAPDSAASPVAAGFAAAAAAAAFTQLC